MHISTYMHTHGATHMYLHTSLQTNKATQSPTYTYIYEIVYSYCWHLLTWVWVAVALVDCQSSLRMQFAWIIKGKCHIVVIGWLLAAVVDWLSAHWWVGRRRLLLLLVLQMPWLGMRRWRGTKEMLDWHKTGHKCLRRALEVRPLWIYT